MLNGQAVEWAVKLGLALGCEIAPHAIFHRKNYFYPDLPKGYQISQYDSPLCVGGTFVVPGPDGDREIGIVRAHLEEDAAKTIHVGGEGGRIHGAGASLVDFNRGGTPLVEIVAEPDIRSPEEARRFLQLLRQTIVELGISDAEMEKGSLRCDANVSVREAGEEGYRTKTELKNMNSFKFVADGIAAEVARQIDALRVRRRGRPGDAALRPVERRASRRCAPRRRRTTTATSPSPTSCRSSRRPSSSRRARRGAAGAPGHAHPPLRGRVRPVVLRRRGAERLGARSPGSSSAWSARAPTRRARRTCSRTSSSRPASTRTRRIRSSSRSSSRRATRSRAPRSPRRIAASGDDGFTADRYLAETSITDASELDPIIDEILAANQGQVEQYSGGKEGLLGFFVGQVMKETGGKANPKVVSERVREKLGA